MATTREYFDNDFGHTVRVNGMTKVAYNGRIIEIEGYLCFDYISNCLFPVHYVKDNDLNIDFFKRFLENSTHTQWGNTDKIMVPNQHLMFGSELTIANKYVTENIIDISIKFPGGSEMKLADAKYYGRIFIYSETTLVEREVNELRVFGKSLDISLEYRSSISSEIRSTIEKPLAFISHDSRDKKSIARELAIKLQTQSCPVWYDEFSLNLGDSLRESIESGIKSCGKCILILTPNFFENKGWVKTEFDSIFTRQILEESNLVLPIWCGITKKDVYNYSPSLLNIVGIKWDQGIDYVTNKIASAISRRSI